MLTNQAAGSGIFPEAVLRTFSGLRVATPVCSPGKRSATGEIDAHTAKNPAPFGTGFFLFDAWQFPTLTWGDPTLPSALRRFTSEFGMGSGGTTALSPPGKFCLPARHNDVLINLYQAENHLKSAKTSSAL